LWKVISKEKPPHIVAKAFFLSSFRIYIRY
jgi:hypothetical protein